MLKKITLIILLVLGLSLIVSCNTFKGMGKDIKNLGEKIEDSAD